MSEVIRPRQSLVFSAGPTAFQEIRRDGFHPKQIGTLAGASGGAKWLVLSQLDRVIARDVLPLLTGPVHTIGTSIGAWRFACYCQADPVAAIDRFEEAYLSQAYSEKPDRDEISEKSAQILDFVLGSHGAREILTHPVLRMHVMTVRSRGFTASENPLALAASLLSVATLNAASRRTLGAFFERVLFHDDRDRSPFHDLQGFPMKHVALTEKNLKDAVLATGSIPLVLRGISNIDGAPPGVYRDGGVIDYHLDFPHSSASRYAMYLHFYDFLKPGWFDKRLTWRRAQLDSVDRTILISPSPQFVARLPNAKIPDRGDFSRMQPAERESAWRKVVSMCEELADELSDVLEHDRLAARLQPIKR
ncbi:MAG: patatin-like phospholipase family protein [Woeseiaceae bacterium]|nr:patatin-like phospholipase family protein [Woeseiaceae bacterium]